MRKDSESHMNYSKKAHEEARSKNECYIYNSFDCTWMYPPRENHQLRVHRIGGIYHANCEDCSIFTKISKHNVMNPSTDFLCKTCYDKKYFQCGMCHVTLSIKERVIYENDAICTGCEKGIDAAYAQYYKDANYAQYCKEVYEDEH